ncbi:MAG: outer membrane protein assembly factor BamA, partial [candidate division WOR-3 bacterium]
MPPVSILLLLAALFSPQPIADSRQPIVLLDISARTTYTDPKLVVRTSGLSPQTVYTPSSFRTALAEAIRKVYELGLFSQVVAETTMLADGVNLTFVVQEYPKLKAVEFEGYRRVKKKDLQAKVKLREGEVLSEKKVFEGQEALKKFYKEKGFLLVQINAVKSPPDSLHQVVLTYAIDEGDPVRIRSIEIYGNEHFTDPQIEIKLVNRQKTWYRKGRLKEEEFIKDLDRIVEFYKQRGFINARVLDYEMKNDRGWVDITITISEGKKYYFGNYAFQSEAAIDTLKLRQLVRYRPGKEYNIKLAQATLADLYTFYSEDGYIYAQISPVEEINADTVNITYEINPGKPALVRLVQIEGNQQTRDNVIRREISSLPGYVFRRSEVLRSQRDIFNLGFFEDVSIDYRPVEAVADSGEGDSAFGAIDLIYKVKEKSFFGTIGAGVSYSAQDKFTGYIELQQPNLLGRGWRSALKLEKGAKKTNFELSFTEPWLFDTPTSAGFDASYLTRSYDYYDKQEIGGVEPL